MRLLNSILFQSIFLKINTEHYRRQYQYCTSLFNKPFTGKKVCNVCEIPVPWPSRAVFWVYHPTPHFVVTVVSALTVSFVLPETLIRWLYKLSLTLTVQYGRKCNFWAIKILRKFLYALTCNDFSCSSICLLCRSARALSSWRVISANIDILTDSTLKSYFSVKRTFSRYSINKYNTH